MIEFQQEITILAVSNVHQEKCHDIGTTHQMELPWKSGHLALEKWSFGP